VSGSTLSCEYLIESGVAARALPGEGISGDLHVIVPYRRGVLVAVIDGLGHGPEAARAAAAAAAVLNLYKGGALPPLLDLCHANLRSTRGAAMNLAAFDAPKGEMSWMGVGNVEGVLLRANPDAKPAREALFQRPGVVGQQFPSVNASVLPLFPGDTLVFATDGIRGSFVERLCLGETPQRMADGILEQSGKSWDDALVLVACYLGERHG